MLFPPIFEVMPSKWKDNNSKKQDRNKGRKFKDNDDQDKAENQSDWRGNKPHLLHLLYMLLPYIMPE
jgi:hypothetical protein